MIGTAPGWHITLVCVCGARGVYCAVVPSLAGDAAARDGWTVLEPVALAAPGDRPAVCAGCGGADRWLRSVG